MSEVISPKLWTSGIHEHFKNSFYFPSDDKDDYCEIKNRGLFYSKGEKIEGKIAKQTPTLKTHKKRMEIKKRYSKSGSLLDEIKSYDIYTVSGADQYPGLPDLNQIQEQESSLKTPKHLPHKCCRRMESDSYSDFKYTKRFKSCYSSLPILLEEGDASPGQECIYKCVSAFLESNESDIHLTSTSECSLSKQVNVGTSLHPLFVDYMSQCSGERDMSESESDSEIEILDDDWESWVDLSKHTSTPTPPSGQQFAGYGGLQPTSPGRVTPLAFGNGEEYLRLLREAQKESNQSSARVSLASSRRDTPRGSPKSPPNSPNIEMQIGCADPALLKDIYLNYFNKEGDVVGIGLEKTAETDWIWDWSSRPEDLSSKEFRFDQERKGNRGASMRRLMVGNSSLFSRDVMYTLLITNVLSILLGTGIGIWLSKRSGGTVTIEAFPLN